MTTTVMMAHCPWCGRNMDRISGIENDAVPEAGDVTLCFGCGEWCIVDEGMHLRKPDDREFDEIGTDADCMKARWAWTEMRKRQIQEEEAKRRAH